MAFAVYVAFMNYSDPSYLFKSENVFSTALNSGVCDGLYTISIAGSSMIFMISEFLCDRRLSC